VAETDTIHNLTSFEKVIDIAKKVKLDWVEKTERGDLPPTLFVERGDKVVAIVMAPQVDRDAGLKAASACRAGFRATAITMILDAHVRMGKKVPEGASMEEAKEDFLKDYKHGDMQRACDEEGACERGEIADVLLIHRMDEAGKVKMHMMPYAYHGKGGAPFKWLEDHPAADVYNKEQEANDPMKHEGYIVETMAHIMKQPALLDRDHQLQEIIKKSGDDMEMDDDRQLYHVGRAILRVLQEQGYMVIDCQDPPPGVKHEPIEPSKQPVSLADLISSDVGRQIGKLIREHAEDENFEEQLLALLTPEQDNIYANADKYEIPHEEVLVADIANGIANGIKSHRKARAAKPKPPYKVKVWNGDRSEYLGEGTYVGDVPVFFIGMPDGSIRSLANAEEKPPEEVIAEMGGELIEAGENPKIVMDKEVEPGRNVMYGCQVWWSPADGSEDDEEDDDHEHHEGCGCHH
jgi:hypothetical protein